MRCYNTQEWILYCKNLIDNNFREEMEEHLADCEICLGAYISAIEESSLNDSCQSIISTELTEVIMERISSEKIKVQSKKITKKHTQTFIYYAIAASLTLMLNLSGFFQFVSDKLPNASYSLASSSVTFGTSIIIDWPEHLLNRTQTIINQINPATYKE